MINFIKNKLSIKQNKNKIESNVKNEQKLEQFKDYVVSNLGGVKNGLKKVVIGITLVSVSLNSLQAKDINIKNYNQEIKTISSEKVSFNEMLKTSLIPDPTAEQYIMNPNKIDRKIIVVKDGGFAFQDGPQDKPLNSIIENGVKYIDTYSHNKLSVSLEEVYKAYLDNNKITSKNNQLLVENVKTDILLLEEDVVKLKKEIKDHSNRYYSYEDKVAECLKNIENIVEKLKTKNQSINSNVDKILDLKNKLFQHKELYFSVTNQLNDKQKKDLQKIINEDRKSINEYFDKLPFEIKKEIEIMDKNIKVLDQTIIDLEYAENSLITKNYMIIDKLNEVKELSKSLDLDKVSSSGKVKIEEKIKNNKIDNKVAIEKSAKTQKYIMENKNTIVDVKESPIPGISIEQYKNYKHTLGFLESTHKYDEMNEIGYIGKYQLGVSALIDQKIILASDAKVESFIKNYRDRHKTTNGWQREFLTDKSNWNLKVCPNGLTSFYNNSELQEKVLDGYTANNYLIISQKIKNNYQESLEKVNGDVSKLSKKTLTSIDDLTPFEKGAILASAHLVGGAKSYSAIIEGKDSKDGNGIKASAYYSVMYKSLLSSKDTIAVLSYYKNEIDKGTFKANANLSNNNTYNNVDIKTTNEYKDNLKSNNKEKSLLNDVKDFLSLND